MLVRSVANAGRLPWARRRDGDKTTLHLEDGPAYHHVKDCTTNNFPLAFKGAAPRLEWKALMDEAKQLGGTSLPKKQPGMLDEDFLKTLHHVLLEIRVEEGAMNMVRLVPAYPEMLCLTGLQTQLLAEHEIG
ncbi:hypothetical protein M0805_000587 [Coniferiporia weirii]|nr:hypothetical protein M0805_000587 [Coniferiporia weirii]